MFTHRLRLGLWALALAASAAACSFPSVEYDDAADADAATGGCSVTGLCADDAIRCGQDAVKEHEACGQKCFGKPDPTCQSDCDALFDTRLGQCAAACESCGQQQGCTDAAANCKGLVGGP